jgi:hypothetical protein
MVTFMLKIGPRLFFQSPAIGRIGQLLNVLLVVLNETCKKMYQSR